MAWYRAKNRKYGNLRVEEDGQVFDSKKEARRWRELHLLEASGEISGLQRQVKYVLIPSQREADIIGKRGGVKKGRLLEHEVAYYADFVYTQDGQTVVEDTKGIKTKEYIIKRKLMLYFYGIRIREI